MFATVGSLIAASPRMRVCTVRRAASGPWPRFARSSRAAVNLRWQYNVVYARPRQSLDQCTGERSRGPRGGDVCARCNHCQRQNRCWRVPERGVANGKLHFGDGARQRALWPAWRADVKASWS
eukprot:135174-Pleurochrysis_carterae.AAC.1